MLGRILVTPSNGFWKAFENMVPADPDLISSGHSAIFGGQGAGLTTPKLLVWMSLPGNELAYHVAHEIPHLILTSLKYPSVVCELRCPVDSGEVRAGKDLEEMVLHPALDKLIDQFGTTHLSSNTQHREHSMVSGVRPFRLRQHHGC